MRYAGLQGRKVACFQNLLHIAGPKLFTSKKIELGKSPASKVDGA